MIFCLLLSESIFYFFIVYMFFCSALVSEGCFVQLSICDRTSMIKSKPWFNHVPPCMMTDILSLFECPNKKNLGHPHKGTKSYQVPHFMPTLRCFRVTVCKCLHLCISVSNPAKIATKENMKGITDFHSSNPN